ncbi:GPI-anchored cell wall beta-1,3-endoglucanase [Diplogelasinospora grovesii]|uniref:Probable glucan endo-1,3-beta-glucosidase eglC n=1 Tax=Diplogelasinospora grovesii TaxID=303347 RepID=A0AAN6NE58_9PEZI|nr:GPI-anchored cell wall beta-1,3-endoglucanase [Diplogelasinospora grovesii]
MVALAAALPSAMAAYAGFNYGSTFTTGAAKEQSDFEAEFKTSQGLVGAPGVFTSARLYTMVQAGTANDPISAIPAAISTKTSLLLGMWASAGDAVFANELQALKTTISNYGKDLNGLVAGISVGSEDLYRVSPTGVLNKENPGAEPLTIANYIKQVRDAISGTALAGVPIGHVDTWTAWVNASNQAVIDGCDFIGVDAYPYFQDTMPNSIDNGKSLFDAAISATQAAVGGKPVWITETGFPVSGKTVGQAVPSTANAKTYWDQVGCPMFGKTNVWWYTLQDAAPQTPNPSFGIVGNTLTTTPLFDISCKNVSTASASSSTPSSTGSASGSGSGSKSSTVSVPTSAVAGGGSPGAGSGLASSQLSLETSALPTATGTGSSSGSGTGSNTTVVTTGTPRPSTTVVTTPNGAGVVSGSVGAAFAAVMAAILVL